MTIDAWERRLDRLDAALASDRHDETLEKKGATVTVKHSTFTLERDYSELPARVFAMWSEAAAEAPWFAGPNEDPLDRQQGTEE